MTIDHNRDANDGETARRVNAVLLSGYTYLNESIEYGEMPKTRSGSCPEHESVEYFVRVPGTNAYVCPERTHSGGKSKSGSDPLPWSSSGRTG